MCTHNFLGCFCLFVYSEKFPCTRILPCRILLSSKQWTTPEGTWLHRTLTTSSNPSSSSDTNQCQCLCLYLAPASSSERKHSESHTCVPHSLNLPFLIHFAPPKERKRNRKRYCAHGDVLVSAKYKISILCPTWSNEGESNGICGGGEKIIFYVLALLTRSQRCCSLLSLSTNKYLLHC